jgi:hypothetical protein
MRGDVQPEGEVEVDKLTKFDEKEHVAYIDDVRFMMPNWFGYDSVDLIVLTTANDEFMQKLSAEKRYQEALSEWVKRGGHLVVSVGRNWNAIAAMEVLKELLPVTVSKSMTVDGPLLAWQEGRGWLPAMPKPPLVVAGFERKPGRSYVSLMNTLGAPRQDIIVQGSAGLGRVTVVAFDLDGRPFTDWKGQPQFWKELLTQAWPRIAAVSERGEDPNNIQIGMPGPPPAPNQQLLTQLHGYLENFEEVPVISFGWVALFIFLYILVVGPLDYFFLKKVVKRLELTWITFPTVVLTISAIAYFTAYYIKGKDLRIRKVDLVDVDLTGPQPLVVGQTWFTIFSPRIQHYTIGIEPVAGGWVASPEDTPEGSAPTVVVSWLGRPETDRYPQRTRGQGLFRRSYDYAATATGLNGVPIQVWDTKSFTAAWQGAADRQRPLVAAELRGKQNPTRFATGRITWLPEDKNNPAAPELKDAWLIYQDRAVQVPLAPGAPVMVNTQTDKGQQLAAWLRLPGQPDPSARPRPGQAFSPLDRTMRAAFFFEFHDQGRGPEQNNCLRLLDQSWRRTNPAEALLVGRLASQQNAAEDVTNHGVSPTRLWLGKLPVAGETRPPLEGILRQDTYIRVILPVTPQ